MPAARLLASLVLELRPGGKPFTSHHALAWLLDEVRRRAPAVADALHQPKRAKPVTVWAGTYDELGGAFAPSVAGAGALVRVTALTGPTVQVLRSLAADPPTCARLGAASLPVLFSTTSSASHPLAGESTDEAVLASLPRNRRLSHRVTLHFLTPTAFSGPVVNSLFPTPALVFRSILGKWNAHASIQVGDAVAAELLERLQVEAHHLATRPPVRLHGAAEKGFVGWCEYSVGRHASDELKRAMHLLARAAFYTGVGARTAMGMGQTIAES